MTSQRKPRLAIMGEFSSGKSTLCNVLLGSRPLLEKVTATQLPPVWLSYGSRPAYVQRLDGTREPLDVADLGNVTLDGTEHVRVFLKSDMLKYCDLIDMPGISDPSMAPEVWERMAHLADGVLWCTHATQAWRQSEAGVWATFPEELRAHSILLVTRFDKIIGEPDRVRVLKRVASETRGMFSEYFPISLTQAMAAGDDQPKWVSSGAYAFTNALFDLVNRLADSAAMQTDEHVESDAPEEAESVAEGIAGPSLVSSHFDRLRLVRGGAATPPGGDRILPRRVQATGARAARGETARPAALGDNVVPFGDRASTAVQDGAVAAGPGSSLTQSKG